jgi:hypothetical protein
MEDELDPYTEGLFAYMNWRENTEVWYEEAGEERNPHPKDSEDWNLWDNGWNYGDANYIVDQGVVD